LGVVFDQLCQQVLELSSFGSGEWSEECVLGGFDSSVETAERAGSCGGGFDEHPAAVVLVADAGDVTTLLEIAEQSVHFAAVDQ
jgi:hypothetical protein